MLAEISWEIWREVAVVTALLDSRADQRGRCSAALDPRASFTVSERDTRHVIASGRVDRQPSSAEIICDDSIFELSYLLLFTR